ncbi:MAG: hypothetical protein M3Q32_12190, partial [Pseudomonadota bacterium]|nr:hypothetical protein [Pseudomonadota bacterium]
MLAGWLGGLFTAIPDFKVELVSVNPVNYHAIAEQAVIKGTWTQPFPPVRSPAPSRPANRSPFRLPRSTRGRMARSHRAR